MAKPKSKEPAQDWAEFPLEQYRQTAEQLVHFSCKTVNSNAPPGGVRLNATAALDWPVVSVRTLLAAGVDIPLDYTKNTGKTATIVKKMRQVALDETPKNVAPEQVQALLAVVKQATATPYEEGTAEVSTRLRQILLPQGPGCYVAVTPLGSTGFSAVLNRKIIELRKREPDWRWRRGYLGYGGSNPQNAGSLVREMRTPLVFQAPLEDSLTQRVLALHYRGVTLRLPHRRMVAYRAWRDGQLAQGSGVMLSDARRRQQEAEHVQEIARVLLKRGALARDLLREYQDRLPRLPGATSLLDPQLTDSVARGLIEPESRAADWAAAFGQRVARAMTSYRFGTQGSMMLATPAVAQLAQWIAEVAR